MSLVLSMAMTTKFAADHQAENFTFASNIYTWLFVDGQVLDAIRRNHSDIRDRDLLTTFGLLAGHHPSLHIPVKSMINEQSRLAASRGLHRREITAAIVSADARSQQTGQQPTASGTSVVTYMCSALWRTKRKTAVSASPFAIMRMQQYLSGAQTGIHAGDHWHNAKNKCRDTSSLSLSRAS